MLYTKRLILRGPQPGDLDDMFAIYSDPRAMQYWSTAPHESRAVTQRRLEWRLNDWHSRKTNFQIELDGRLIGNAGNHVDNEVGFILHPDHWRKGIITEAMGAIIPFLWANTNHTELTADADRSTPHQSGCSRPLVLTKPTAPKAHFASTVCGPTSSTSLCRGPRRYYFDSGNSSFREFD